ncbi:MAG: TatD family hydrolase [Anaerorhabdus sp.]
MEKIGWIDSHVHLTDETFKDDLDEVLARTKENGIERMLVICLSYEELEQAFKLQQRDKRIDIAFGFFPTSARELNNENRKKMEVIAADERVIAIGEIGLDYYWEKDESERALQRESFIFQIELARKVNKPILVHSRDAAQDTLEILKQYPGQGVLHCYSYGVEIAQELVRLGYMISLAGPLTFKNARVPKEVAQAIPLENLLIETDCPYLTPEPHRGTRNEPTYVVHIGEYLAKIKEVKIEKVREQLSLNYKKTFLNK